MPPLPFTLRIFLTVPLSFCGHAKRRKLLLCVTLRKPSRKAAKILFLHVVLLLLQRPWGLWVVFFSSCA